MMIIIFIISIIVHQNSCLSLPLNEYNYMIGRKHFREYDQAIQLLRQLNWKERIVNLYFEYLRAEEFLQTKTYFYPSRPIEKGFVNITSSEFYQYLYRLPKGGNLHLHEYQTLDRRIFLQSIVNSEDYDFLYICDQISCQEKKYFLTFFHGKSSPIGWTKVKDSNWTIDQIVEKTTLIGILNHLKTPLDPTDTESRWNLATQSGVFSFYADLVKYNRTRLKYLQLVLDQALDENVQLVELRRGFFGNLFYFDANGTKVSIPIKDELNQLIEFKKAYLKNNSKLIDFHFILYNVRRSSKDEIEMKAHELIELHRTYPELIRGYDMVGDEDRGHTLLYHHQNLIQLYNYSQLNNETFHFFFHAGETNWPEEHLPSHIDDGVSTFENIYDALLLRTRRIGHGLSLAKRPDLYPYIRQENIAIEVCPASNQILGYVADLRNHPGIVYYRSGIPIVLAGDDPGSFGYNQLTVDFYLSTMAWGLNLADLKQLAWNSIEFSSISQWRKIQGLEKWKIQWNGFIEYSYRLACQQRFSIEMIYVSDRLPAYGPGDRSINITLFGSGFQAAICKTIRCRFGEEQTKGIFVDLNEILCPTPSNNNHSDLFTVPIDLIIANRTIQTGFSFQYRQSLRGIESIPSRCSIANCQWLSFSLIFILFK